MPIGNTKTPVWGYMPYAMMSDMADDVKKMMRTIKIQTQHNS
jgi:hypothetical protein